MRHMTGLVSGPDTQTQTQTQFIWPAISYNMHKKTNQSLLSGDSTKKI